MNKDMTSVSAVKCTNGHQYYGVIVGPCPICGTHTEMSAEQLVECAKINRKFTAKELVELDRSNKMRVILPVAKQTVSNCYVQQGGDMAQLDNLVACASHAMDKIEIIQDRIKTDYDRKRNA